MGDVRAPGDMPQAPILPEVQPMVQTMDTSTFSIPNPALNFAALEPPVVEAPQNIAYGMATRTYEVPVSVLEKYKSENPLDVAIRYESGKIPQEGGPTTTLTGYDVRSAIGDEGWNSLLNAKSRDRGSEQRALYNLAILPTTFDPGLAKSKNLSNLADLDFRDLGSLVMEKDPDYVMGESGGGGSGYRSTNAPYSDQLAYDMLYRNRESSGINKFMSVAIPGTVFAAMAAMTGGAAGTLFSPAGGAVGGAAGGLAGGLGMSAGAGATAVNMIAGAIASMGAKVAAEQMGLPMDHPLMQAGMAMVAGAAGGLTSGAGAPVQGGALPTEGNPQGIFNYLEQNNLSPGELMDMMGEEEFVRNFGDPTQFTRAYDQFSGAVGGIGGGIPMEGGGIEKGFTKNLFDVGMGAYGATAPTNQTSPFAGGAITEEAMLSGEIPQGISPEDYARYNSEYSTYEQQFAEYNRQAKLYEQMQQMQADYESKMTEFSLQQKNYMAYKELQSKQKGIASAIGQSISENPYYDAPENYTGPQSFYID